VQQSLHEHQTKQKDQWRKIDAAKIWKDASDGAEQWFGQTMQGVIDLADNIVRIVEDIECHQPAHDNHDDDDPEDDENQLVKQPNYRQHPVGLYCL
jgi:hypothetical protein